MHYIIKLWNEICGDFKEITEKIGYFQKNKDEHNQNGIQECLWILYLIKLFQE